LSSTTLATCVLSFTQSFEPTLLSLAAAPASAGASAAADAAAVSAADVAADDDDDDCEAGAVAEPAGRSEIPTILSRLVSVGASGF
jgi:hypothetical protein